MVVQEKPLVDFGLDNDLSDFRLDWHGGEPIVSVKTSRGYIELNFEREDIRAAVVAKLREFGVLESNHL